MIRDRVLVPGIILIVIAAVAVLLARTNIAQTNPQHITVRWLESHQPEDVFARAEKVFGDELAKDSNGTMSLEVVTPQDVGVSVGDVPNTKVFDELDSGSVQLATEYTVGLGFQDNALWALNLPFAFGSYGELPAVLDGQVGMSLLSGIADKTNARGLAFTMSGGFRIIATKDKPLRTPADLKGLHIATSGGPVAEATLKALGAIPVPLNLESGSANIDLSTIDGVETTYSRLSEVLGSKSPYLTYINETDHSVFLTAIIANSSFYNSLSPQQQSALQKAALAAAQIERQDSISLGNTTRDQLASSGSTIVTLSPDQRAAFKAATQSVYDQFLPIFGEQLTDVFRSR